MSNETEILSLPNFDDRVRAVAEKARHLSGGGGGGTSGGVEERVTRLERNVDQLIRDIGELRVDVATLKERVAHLPGKGFVVTATTTSIALIGAIVLFADKLRALVGG